MKLFKKQLGFALPIAVLIVAVLIIVGGVGYYFYLSRGEALRDKSSQEQKEISCTTNSDCGADACHQEGNVCFEVSYVCENEKCSSTSKEYANYFCAKDYYGSINFTGGTILEVEYKEVRPEIRVIAEKLADLFGSISIQPIGEKGIILKMKHIDEITHQQVLQRLGEVEEKYFESVRGTIDYSKCMDTCGDDICRLPEIKDWCPEDCFEQPEPVLNETADWKIYRDEEHGFEVRYPNEWKFEGKTGAPPSPTFIYRYDEKSYCRFNVVITDVNDTGAISDLKSKGYNETKTTIDGILAIKLSKSPVGMNLESRDYVYFNKGLNYYWITRMSFRDANEKKCLKTFNQILSTFKFIEESVSPPVTEKQIGYIKAIYTKNNKEYLDIDYVQYLTGDEAIEAMREDGKCPVDIYPDPSYCIPNGFYIRNQNPKIRTFEVSKDVKILRVFISPPQSYEDFKNHFIPEDPWNLTDSPFHIQVINGIVVEITEQYIP